MGADGQSGTELWRILAQAGPKATAEALGRDDLQRMHVETPLDAFIADHAAQGKSLVLTGNAGDGKTHALLRAASQLQASGAIFIPDATAEMRRGDPAPILKRWQEAVTERRPFCIAINEYPLYQLRKAAPEFEPLAETWRQSRHRLAYRETLETVSGDIVVVDLSLRNPLSPGFADAILDAILNDPAFVAFADANPQVVASENATRLRDPRVRGRLRAILERAVALGARVTVREMWILAARMVMGRNPGRDFNRADWYFEALFASPVFGGSGSLARALDPAACSHPRWDNLLEGGKNALEDGWRFGPPPVPPQPRLDQAVFTWLKRAFHFEHDHGETALELADPEAAEFMALLAGATTGRHSVVTLIDAINAAYCPARFSGREHHLYLWSGHRFHEQPSRSFVATERIAADDLHLEVPRLPAQCEGAFDFVGDHMMLVAPTRDGTRLRIDYPLFRTLRRLGRGLPRKLVPEREIHRLDAFLEQLGGSRAATGDTVWSVHLEHMQVLRIGLAPDRRSYETVRTDA